MAFDAHKNFAYSTVLTAPSTPTAGTSLVVQSGDGANFPTAPFNATVWPSGAQPTAANAEIIRVTSKSTDTFTITRAQESTSARSIGIGDQISATVTAKTLTDVEVPGTTGSAATVSTTETTTSTTYAFLTTTTDQVTVTIGANGLALVLIECGLFNSGANDSLVSVDVSGATTIAAADTRCIRQATTSAMGLGGPFLITGLTAGSTTFKLKYRVAAGTGSFFNRNIAVIAY